MYPDSVETAEYASPPSSQVAAEDWVHSLVQEESNLPEWNDSTLDGISDSEIDDVFVELPNEDCLGSEMAGGMDSEVTLSGALQPEDNSGVPADGAIQEAWGGCTSNYFPADQTEDPGNEGKSTLDNKHFDTSVESPLAETDGDDYPSTTQAAPLDTPQVAVRPQLQPVGQLSVPRNSDSMPYGMRMTGGRGYQADASFAQDEYPKTQSVANAGGSESIPKAMSRETLKTHMPVTASFSTAQPRGLVRKESRGAQDVRPQIAPVPHIMPREIRSILPNTVESKIETDGENVSNQKSMADQPISQAATVSGRKNDVEKVGENEAPNGPEVAKTSRHKAYGVFGLLLSGLVVFPRRIRKQILCRVLRDRISLRRPIDRRDEAE